MWTSKNVRPMNLQGHLSMVILAKPSEQRKLVFQERELPL